MRKIDPDSVRSDFDHEVEELVEHFNRVASTLSGSSHELADISRLAEVTFLSIFVSWERFLSDLFFAYLNRDFSVYQKKLTDRIQESIEENFGEWVRGRVSFQATRHASVAELEKALDPEGFNLTFRTMKDVKKRAKQWLSAQYCTGIQSLRRDDERVIDTARAIRNFIAHQSKSSKARMNSQLKALQSTRNASLGRGTNEIHKAGAFLKVKTPPGGLRRIELYARRLQTISAKM